MNCLLVLSPREHLEATTLVVTLSKLKVCCGGVSLFKICQDTLELTDTELTQSQWAEPEQGGRFFQN